MKKNYAFIVAFLMVSIHTLTAQVGIGTVTPQGALDISSSTNGMLIPRVNLTALSTAAPVVNPQGGALVAGTLVYNQSPATVAVGFYFWDGTKWTAISGGAAATTGWSLTGNTGTDTSTNFVGNTDATDLHFRTSNVNKFRIKDSSNQLLGYGGTSASPTYSWEGTATGGPQTYGMWYSVYLGTPKISFSTNSTERFAIPNADQVHAIPNGTAASPFYSWQTANTTGMFKIGNTTAAQLAFATNGLERFRILANGDIGINNIAPKTKLEVAGAVSLNEGTALTLVNGINNNVGLGTTPYSSYRITGPTAAFSISGIVPATGADGQIVTIENTTAQDMTILHQSGSSTAANQFLCVGAKNLLIKGQYATVTLQYNESQARWIIKSYVGEAVSVNQREIYAVKGTTDITLAASSHPVVGSFSDMDEMTYTFTPKNNLIYINFSAAGDVITTGSPMPQSNNVRMRLVNVTNGNEVLAGMAAISTDYAQTDDGFTITSMVSSGWNVNLNMYPLVVTAGVPITLKIQWSAQGITGRPARNLCATGKDFSHRTFSIID